MFSSENLSQFNLRNYTIWMLLAFQSGTINVGGFLACHRFVTHTTGFATFFGADLAKRDFHNASGMILVPLFFLAGTIISAFLVDRRIIQNKQPRYRLVLFINALLNTIIFIAGLNGSFGQFGTAFEMSHDFSLLALLCLSSGIQNASISSASKNAIRTTHLTGNTTDLGIGLVRLFFNELDENKTNEKHFVLTRAGIICFFILGSSIAAYIFIKEHYWGFIFPAIISTTLWIYSLRRFRRIKDQ